MQIVTVCADDYGFTPTVSAGIRECLEKGRISAASCMTIFPAWHQEAMRLKPYLNTADIGLHFTLTDHASIGPMPELAPQKQLPSLRKLLARAFTRRLPLQEIRDEFVRQLDAFESELGAPPSHIDGHHHIHQLPGIRDVIIAALVERYEGKRPYLRVSQSLLPRLFGRSGNLRNALKAWPIGIMGSRMRQEARKAGIATNSGFSGVYDFNSGEKIDKIFAGFIEDIGPQTLIMCHPGRVDDELRQKDSLTEQRQIELDFLLSARWPEMLEEQQLRLGQLPHE